MGPRSRSASCVRRALAGALLGALAAASALTSAGCAQEVGLIDRTQAGLLQKSLFDGEWFMRRTVIEVPYDVGYTFVGEQEEVVRVRWDIQENLLVAHRVHPFVTNTDIAAPVAAFAIKEHVDVIREYNAATGEQTNVLSENTTDRMWFHRDHVRVDWSRNVLTNFAFYIDQLALEPVAYTTEDPRDPDRVLIGVRAPDGAWTDHQDPATLKDLDHADYLDVVTQVFVKPEDIVVEDWDGATITEPACWYYLNSDCAPAIVRVRNAFLRVDAAVAPDYEPLHYPDNAVAREPDGDPIRVRYDANGDRVRVAEPATPGGAGPGAGGGPSGPTDPYAAGLDASFVRLPFFDKFGFFRTERFGYDPLYGEIEASRTYLANRWNLWQRTRGDDGALLPFAERGLRPIVFYLSPDFPAALRPAADRVADAWDAALRDAVRPLIGAEPPRIFELRDNTRAVDPVTGEVTRRGEVNGDLRYSHLYYVDSPLRVGLLGYGPSAIDPLTGEIFQADAYIYGAIVRQVAAQGRDVVDLLNGRLDPTEIATGQNVAHYHAAIDPSARRAAPTDEEIATFARDHRGAAPPARAGARPDKRPPMKPSAADARQRPGIDKLRRPHGFAHGRLARVKGTPLEELLMGDPELHRHFAPHANPSSPLSAADRARVSPTRWASPNYKRRQMERFRAFGQRNMYMASFVDDAVAGTALELLDTPSEQIVDLLAERIFRSTAEHEVGHTLGLRHNFEGSHDALNYHPEYWALRGDDPAPMAALTPAERDGKLREYQYSSIMDYHGRFNTDTAGLGRYDRAAIKFAYAGLVEVFETPPVDPLLDVRAFDDDTYERTFTLAEVVSEMRHYTKLPQIFGGAANLGRRLDVPWDEATASLMGAPAGSSYQAQLLGDAPWRHWEVPYRYCSDEYVGATGTCHAFDLGADMYEIVVDAIDRYDNYYWFNNFKRDRVTFDEWEYMDTMWWRHFAFIHLAHQNWVFDQWFTGEVWEWLRDDPTDWGIADVPWTEAIDGGATATAAMMESMRFLNRVLAMPEPGAYWYDFDEEYYWSFSADSLAICEDWAWESEDWCSDTNVALGEGRFLNSIYDWESGYHFYERLRWVGSFYDKLLALEAMTSPDTFFLGVAAGESFDQWAISMYLSFPLEIQKILSGIAADRFDLFAGVVEEEGFTYLPPDPFATGADAAARADYGPVDPSTSFTIQLYGLWYGMALLNANYDNTFNDLAKVWVAGSAEELEPVDPDRLVEFRNPFNQRIYRAITSDDPALHGVGETMVRRAADYVAEYEAYAAEPDADPDYVDYYRWRVVNITENLEVVRGMYSLYGYLHF